MAGSIRQRSPGVWELRVYLGRDNVGRVRHQYTTFAGTKRAAERELARLVTHHEEKPARVPQKEEEAWGPTTTINDAIEGWKRNGWQDLSPNTVRGYEGVWRRNVRDSIGRRRIATLSPYDIERYFRDLKAGGAGHTTVRLARALLNRSCRLARKWSGNVLPNPVCDTELPSWGPEERPKAVRSPEPAEVLALLGAARVAEVRVAVLIRLVAATGMRWGEACAVRWNGLDTKAGTVVINEGVVSTPAGAEARQPKTRSSTRTVALDKATLMEIADLRREQEALAASCGLDITPESFVFSFEPGGAPPAAPGLRQPLLRQDPHQGEDRPRYPPALAAALPCHPDRLGNLRSPEAGPARLVDRADGPALHRRGPRGGQACCRSHGTPVVCKEAQATGQGVRRPLTKVSGSASGRSWCRSRPFGVESIDEPLDGPAWDPDASADPEHRQWESTRLQCPVERGAWASSNGRRSG